MLTGDFRPTSEIFMNCSVEVLACCVRYIYCGIDSALVWLLKNELLLCLDVLFASDMYALPGLQFYCERVLGERTRESLYSKDLEDRIEQLNLPLYRAMTKFVYKN
jgi:hypothetical protein